MTLSNHGGLRRLAGVFLAGSVALTGCVSATPETLDRSRITTELESALYNTVTGPDGAMRRHAMLAVDAPTVRLSYLGAAGIARANSSEPIAPDRQFLVASVGKTMTAVVIHQLAEEGAFGPKGIDAKLADLDVFPAEVLAELHKIDGVSYAHDITLRHLLNHTSGLRDLLFDTLDNPPMLMPGTPEGAPPGSLVAMMAFDPERGLTPLADCAIRRIPAGCNPDDYLFRHHWAHWDYAAWKANPDDRMAGLINYYLAGLNEHALWKPGQGFHYGDTNYILLGLVIEKVSGHSLHHELRARIFDPLRMDNTYLVAATDPPAERYQKPLAEAWAWDQPTVSAGVDYSFDWGGGGIVSTIEDLHVFTRALMAGELYTQPGTLDQMLTVPQGIDGLHYASGLIVFPTRQGPVMYMVGSNGTWVEYYPPLDLVTVGTVDDFSNMPGSFALNAQVYAILARHGLPTPMAVLSGPPMWVITISLPVLVILDVVWLVAALWARRKQAAPAGSIRTGRWLAAGAFAANVVLILLTGMAFGDNVFQMLFGFSPQVRMLFVITAAVIGGLSVVMIGLAARQWRRGEGRVIDRAMLSLVGAFSLAYAVAVGLLG